MEFIGQAEAKLDAKNRVFMPASFRHTFNDARQDRVIVRKDFFENCLVIYPMEWWRAEVDKVRSKLNRFDSRQEMVYRKLVSEAQEVAIDANGRILIPKVLLDRVGIKQDVLFVGMEQTIEVWALENVKKESGQPFMSDDEFARSIMELMSESKG